MFAISNGDKAIKCSAVSEKETLTARLDLYERHLLNQCSSGIDLVEDLFCGSDNLKKMFIEKNEDDNDKSFFQKSYSNQFKKNTIEDITDIIKNIIVGKGATGTNITAPFFPETISGDEIMEVLSDKENAEKIKETLESKMIERVIKSWEACLPLIKDKIESYTMAEAIINVKKKIYESPQKVVGLIDDWKTKLKNKKTHGYCSENVIRTCDPTAKIIKVQLPIAKFSDGTTGYHNRAMYIAMRKLNKELEKGIKFDGINLSSGWNFDFAVFSDHMNGINETMADYYQTKQQKPPDFILKTPKSFTSENIGEYKPQLRELIHDYATKFKGEMLDVNRENIKNGISLFNECDLGKSTPFYYWLDQSLGEIEKYTKKTNTVFTISGGNYGKEKFNPLSLAENVVTVGAMDKNGKIYDWSVNNTLVNNFTEGRFVDEDQQLVPNFLYNKNIWEKAASFLSGKSSFIIEGTSLSSPFELMMRLKEKINLEDSRTS